MKLMVDLDPKTVWAVAAEAERLGVANSQVLEIRLAGLRSAIADQRLRELHRDGLCDADIADQTGHTVGHIATVRRRLGLTANRRYSSDGG